MSGAGDRSTVDYIFQTYLIRKFTIGDKILAQLIEALLSRSTAW
jgi:hypothetical protein